MSKQFNPNVSERASEFVAAQSNPSSEHLSQFVQDLQKDAQAARAANHGNASAAYKDFYSKDLKPLNERLKDSLPKLHISGDSSEQAQIMGLTAEKGEKKGIVLAAGIHDGKADQVVILTRDGRYVEAQRTENGFIPKEGGKEFQRNADGVLEEKKKSSETEKKKPELHLDESELKHMAFAKKLLMMVHGGEAEQASRDLRELAERKPEVAKTVARLMEKLNPAAEGERRWWNPFDQHVKPIHIEYDKKGLPIAVWEQNK